MAAMLVGVAAFAFMDAGLKLLTAHYPAAQVAALRGLAALPVVFAWALYSGGLRQLDPGALAAAPGARRHVGVHDDHLRVRAEDAVAGQGVRAVFRRAAADRAAVDLHARRARATRAVGRDRASGFVGVLIVLKPETGGFGWWGTLAVLGTARVLFVVLGPREDSRPHRQHAVDDVLDDRACWPFGATLLALAGLAAHCAASTTLILAGVAVTGAIGQWGVTVAFKHAPAASVAPLEYSGLAWVILIDLAVWAAVPGLRTLRVRR